MTQEEKQLLLIDISARLPYGVKVNFKNAIRTINALFDDGSFWLDDKDDGLIEEIKPYLRPMSNMAEEEKIELCTISYAPDEMKTIEEKLHVVETNAKYAADFYNEHHFDYRGLIEKGLALEALDGMYNTSQKWTPLRSGLKENEDGQIVGGVKL